jgi:ribosomal RNA assembly protein
METYSTGLVKKNFNVFPKNLFICKSIFLIMFPKYQEKKLRESWKIINRILESVKIRSKIDIFSGSIQIWNTKLTRDPFALFNARDFLRLISRGVPFEQAAKIFEDKFNCDIIKICLFGENKKVFLKRRKRLIGKNGSTIKAIEMLTQTYLLIQGNTVSCIGQYSNLKQVRKIVEDCMKNVHPIFHIRLLILKKELTKDVSLKKKSWDKFIPYLSHTSNNNRLQKTDSCKIKKKSKVFAIQKEILYERYKNESFFDKKQIKYNFNFLNNKYLLKKKSLF